MRTVDLSLEAPSVFLLALPLYYWHGVKVLHVWSFQSDEEQLCQLANTQVTPPVSHTVSLCGTEAHFDLLVTLSWPHVLPTVIVTVIFVEEQLSLHLEKYKYCT